MEKRSHLISAESGDTGVMPERDKASVTPIDTARRRRRAGAPVGDALERILNAGIDLARGAGRTPAG